MKTIDLVNELWNKDAFSTMIEEQKLLKEKNPEAFLKLIMDEAAKKRVILTDLEDFDYEKEYDNLYNTYQQ